ncbi:hypothetical protein SAMN06295998_1187 [Primorskyibacter flagellatus]|uniref:Uncharacterized protein n=1 Tax=Primorskyibacter flagellatus TaxID=1387277 RepID=A0A1W2DV54_9RHOB|nr:hypothetical protein SAMN06295998_1187 [Primorskyibacter flagellatus]
MALGQFGRVRFMIFFSPTVCKNHLEIAFPGHNHPLFAGISCSKFLHVLSGFQVCFGLAPAACARRKGEARRRQVWGSKQTCGGAACWTPRSAGLPSRDGPKRTFVLRTDAALQLHRSGHSQLPKKLNDASKEAQRSLQSMGDAKTLGTKPSNGYVASEMSNNLGVLTHAHRCT